jgi:hypothetical protein
MNERKASGLLAGTLLGLLSAGAFAAEPLPCTPVPAEEILVVPSCVTRSDEGRLVLTQEALATLYFDVHGLTAISVDRVLYHANRKGRTAPALPFDNGTDYIVEGLTRIRRNGKVGFVNSDLHEVIEARWDFAFPFAEGVAVVCDGCRGVKDGEHVVVVGGVWGYIDTRGQPIVPPRYTRDTLPTLQEAKEALRASE